MHGTVCIGDAVNWDSPLNRGLVSWWLALPDQQRGNVFRDLCMRNHGTLANGPTWRGVMGRPGGVGSLQFVAGSTNICNLAGVAVSDPSTIAGWLFPIASSDNFGAILTSDATGLYYRGSVRKLHFYNSANLSAAITESTWTHFAVTFTASATIYYLNGSLDISSSGGNSFTATRIGNDGSSGNYSGHLDDLRVYNRILSASEISNLFQDSRAGYPTTLNWSRPMVGRAQDGAAAFIDNNNPIWRHILAGVL